MKAGHQRQTFNIKCECIIMRNNLAINTKRKSKFSVISLDPEKNSLHIVPFGLTKEEEKPFTFSLTKLRTIHKKYIQEGKMTLQFLEKAQKVVSKGLDVMANQQKRQIFTSILISSASKENLELMISKITEIKKKEIDSKKNNEKAVPTPKTQQFGKRKPNVSHSDQQQHFCKLNRKDLRNLAANHKKVQTSKNENKAQTKSKTPKVNFFDLPCSILDSIFQYTKINLKLRLVNKQFSSYVLQNLRSVKFHDLVDEKTFNKLAMWAINVECKMSCVKNVNLKDRFQDQELIKNRAKTLKFGHWKQITARNITQLKGLRTYCLQLPYSMKFDLSHLYGQRMVELRLKGSPFLRNDFIKTQAIAYILTNIRQIKVLELPYCTSDLFDSIEFPKRLQELSLYSINDLTQTNQWANLSKFENLLVFNCWYLEKGFSKKQKHQIQMTFPPKLMHLQIGSFATVSSLQNLPQTVVTLHLIGEYYNKDLENIFLPNLIELDVSQTKNIRAQIIEYLQNVTLITNWSRQTVQYMNRYAKDRNITLKTTQWMTQ